MIYRRKVMCRMTMRLCLRWQNTEAGLMLEQVRLWLPGLQTSAASAHLFPWQQHLFSDTATIRGRGERDKLKGRKEGGDKDRWRQIKERKMGRESAVVAPADKAELFMRPRFSSHHETKTEIVLSRQLDSPGQNKPPLRQQHLHYVPV